MCGIEALGSTLSRLEKGSDTPRIVPFGIESQSSGLVYGICDCSKLSCLFLLLLSFSESPHQALYVVDSITRVLL
jgi:hypothetical protein